MADLNMQFDDEPYSKRVGSRLFVFGGFCLIFFVLTAFIATEGHPTLFFDSSLWVFVLVGCLILIGMQVGRERFYLLSVISNQTGMTLEYYDNAHKTTKFVAWHELNFDTPAGFTLSKTGRQGERYIQIKKGDELVGDFFVKPADKATEFARFLYTQRHAYFKSKR